MFVNIAKQRFWFQKHIVQFCRCKSDFVSVSEEVRFGLECNKPVVALESTIITHGMPYPDNVKCALEVEEVVRKHGAIPATVAILKGQIHVGLNSNQINQLADITTSNTLPPIKTSRRDLSYVVANKRNGGTTVSSTLIVANQIGLPIFATGGIGGVHRKGESTFDISADLIELGRSRVAVVSSGIKSILDIPKTLEFLETQGVFVSVFGESTDFPAFYTRRSGCHVPYCVRDANEAAHIIRANFALSLNSGMLFGVPVPEEYSLDEQLINGAIEEALIDGRNRGVGGKEITPFLLGRIAKITEGRSLETNIALIKNNAKTAADISVALSELKEKKPSGEHYCESKTKLDTIRPVVIGGSNLDCTIQFKEAGIQMDGRMHYGDFVFSAGGVGRNIADALTKLGCVPFFISALGTDPQGAIIKEMMPREMLVNLRFIEAVNTATCSIVLDDEGDCKFLIGAMDMHKQITPQVIAENENEITKAPLIIFDGNLSIDTIDKILSIANEHQISALFEPTDLVVATKPFQSIHWKAVKYITPNLNELREIAGHFQIEVTPSSADKFEEIKEIVIQLIEHIDNIIVTLGVDGLVIARKACANDQLFNFEPTTESGLSVRHYSVDRVKDVINVNGAGDSLASGVIYAMLKGLSEEECVAVGIEAAKTALRTSSTVASELFGAEHRAWKSKAAYKTLL